MGNNISKKDLLNMFIICKYNLGECLSINLNTLMNVLAKYAMNPTYKDLFKLIKITISEGGPKVIDLTEILNLYIKNGIISELDDSSNFSITANQNQISILKRKYENIKYAPYLEMIHNINHDLKKENKCEILYIDETMSIPDYPILKKRIIKDTH